MKVVLVGMFFFLVGVHPSCYKEKEGKNASWEWSPKIGFKEDDVSSVDCERICFDDYACVALTYMVRLLVLERSLLPLLINKIFDFSKM